MRFFATAAKGTEGPLRDELRALRLPQVRADRGGVHFEGTLDEAMRACLHARVAVRVLAQVGSFDAPSEVALYDGVRAIDWAPWLSPRHTLAVSATCRASRLTHSHYIALKTKDAVVDQLRDQHGARPDVNTTDPDVALVVHLLRDRATVYLDLAGEALHRRGYRLAATEAVMKETLAAAVVLLSGWDPTRPFHDPLCGSGTLAIEAALIARRRAPGLERRFGFERWPAFDESTRRRWRSLREEARARILPRAPAPITASDVSEAALDATRRNGRVAGVDTDLTLRRADVRALGPSEPPGHVVTDPPYGDRLAADDQVLVAFARDLGRVVRALTGHTVVLLSGNPLLARNLGLRPAREHTLFNGPIECRLLRYDP